MKVLVAVKRVLDYNVKPRVKADGTGVDLANVKMSMNPFDEIAIEEAVRLKEKGAATEVVVVTIGVAKAETDVLLTARAMGCDRGILIATDDEVEPLGVAKLLKAVCDEEQPGLVILGKQAIDDDSNQTGQMLAALLGWPQGTFASKVEINGDRVVVIREVDKLKKDARRLLDQHLKRPATDMVLLLVSPAGVKADKGLSDHAVAVEFAPLTGERVERWVTYHVENELGGTISADAVALLVGAVGDDLAQLAVEIEKLASFSDGSIDEAAISAVVGVRKGETLSALLDAVAARDAAAALPLIPGVLQHPKMNAVLLGMHLTTQMLALAYGEAARARGVPSRALYNEFMSLLKETGAFPGRPWGEAVNAWSKYSDRWTAPALDIALGALLLADEALKETKVSSDEQLITSLVLALCGAGSARRAA